MNTIHITIPKHFSFKEALSFLDRGYDDCLYRLSENSVSRLLHFSDGVGLIHVSQNGSTLKIDIEKEQITPLDVQIAKNYVIEWFDLQRDITPFYKLLESHSHLSHFHIKYAGCRIVGIPDLFEAISWAIIGQQINLTFAYRIKRNLVEKLGLQKTVDNQTYYLFPSPEKILSTDPSVLKALKFSRQKIDYIYNISQAFIEQKISKNMLNQLDSKEERIAKLTAIKGIGIWTANYVLMKCIRDMSCITYNDSGLNRALVNIFETEKKPNKKVVDEIFSAFPNWESYLNFYLWRSLGKD